MINKLRRFSNSKLAMVVVGIIIVPFVFWGMGSVFSGGNTNNIAKINNEPISSKDFINHINQSRLTNEIIRENLENNILDEILSELISDLFLNHVKIFEGKDYFFNGDNSDNGEVFEQKEKGCVFIDKKILLGGNELCMRFENRFDEEILDWVNNSFLILEDVNLSENRSIYV